jgi:polyisoprenoid-binding protein YceI
LAGICCPHSDGAALEAEIMRDGTRAICLAMCVAFACAAFGQEVFLQCDAGQTNANWNLSDPLHTVKGDFQLKQCRLQYEPASGKIEGEIVFDATSGKSGNGTRDRKMHKDVLESARYPEIRFRPDHVEGKVELQGTSNLQVHGIFSIHGGDHEITLPVVLKMDAANWSATASFAVPYVKWGMKNPSILFLRVGDDVALDVQAAGRLTNAPAQSAKP